VSYLPIFEKKFDIKVVWNYFATSHGKGPVDAIGDIVKRQVSTKVLQRRAIVKDSESFYKCALEACSGVNIYHITSSKIKAELNKNQAIFETAQPLAGIKSKHQISFDNNKIMMKTYANESIEESNDTLEMTEVPEPEDIQPGTFVIAGYDFLGKNDSIKTLRLVAVVKEVIGKKYELAYSKSDKEKIQNR